MNTQCFWWCLPRETRVHICDFYNQLVQIERVKKEKFAPVVREILVLGVLPGSFRRYIRERAKQQNYYFPPNRLIYFREIYTKCQKMREWTNALAPIINAETSGNSKKFLAQNATKIWQWWRWNDPNLTMNNLWTEIYQLAKGMTEVFRRKKK